jgi:hypothetical protein
VDGFLKFMGILFLLVIAACLVIAGYYALTEWIDHLKYEYRYKHRFDKPPTAKCYCIDCKYHNNGTNQCYRFGETTKEYRCTADNWFCWEAEPRDKE